LYVAEVVTVTKQLVNPFPELVYLLRLQLFGYYNEALWQPGLLTTALQKASRRAELLTKFRPADTEAASGRISRWIVLDGELNPAWTDGVNCLLSEPYSYCALNSEISVLHGQRLAISALIKSCIYYSNAAFLLYNSGAYVLGKVCV